MFALLSDTSFLSVAGREWQREGIGLPLEITEKVIGLIDEVNDLLRLAQTCRALYHCVIRRDLQWRRVCILHEDFPTFLLLSTTPSVALAIREIALVENPRHIPTGYFSRPIRTLPLGADEVEEHTLPDWYTMLDAATGLSWLQSVTLRVRRLSKYVNLFLALRVGSSRLTNANVEIVRSDIQWDLEDNAIVVDELPVIQEMAGYVRFSWESHDTSYNPVVVALTSMLSATCPALEYLSIRVPNSLFSTVSDAFWSAYWPRLRKLHIQGVQFGPEMGDFLSRHGRLEDVALEDAVVFDIPTPPHALSSVRRVHVPWCTDTLFYLTLLSRLPSGSPRNMEYLTIGDVAFPISDGPDVAALCDRLITVPTLRRLRWICCVSRFARSLLQVGRAALSVRALELEALDSNTVSDLSFFEEALSSFPALENVSFECRSGSVRTAAWDKEAVRRVGSACPCLTRINEWTRGEAGEWVWTRD